MNRGTIVSVLGLAAASLTSCAHPELTGSAIERAATPPGPILPGTTTCYNSVKHVGLVVCRAKVTGANVVEPDDLQIPRIGKVVIVWKAPANGYFDKSAGDGTNLTDPAFTGETATDDDEDEGDIVHTGRRPYLRIKFNFANQTNVTKSYHYRINVHTSAGPLAIDPTINNSAGLL